MMVINAAQLLKAPQGTLRRVEFSEWAPALSQELGLTAPVTGSAQLMRTGSGILVTCTYVAELELTCARCLSVTRHLLESKLEEMYLPAVDMLSGEPISLQGDGDYFTLDERHNMDLSEALRQSILVSVPLRPLCQSDCRGLCPSCGYNLNQGSCNCAPEGEDSPFRVLAGYLAQVKGK